MTQIKITISNPHTLGRKYVTKKESPTATSANKNSLQQDQNLHHLIQVDITFNALNSYFIF